MTRSVTAVPTATPEQLRFARTSLLLHRLEEIGETRVKEAPLFFSFARFRAELKGRGRPVECFGNRRERSSFLKELLMRAVDEKLIHRFNGGTYLIEAGFYHWAFLASGILCPADRVASLGAIRPAIKTYFAVPDQKPISWN